MVLVDLRIVTPDLFAGAGVDSEGDTPGRDAVDHAVGNKRRRLLSASTVSQLISPGQPQAGYIRSVDLFQRAIALLGVVQPDRQPFFAGLSGVLKGRVRNLPVL